MLCSTLSQMRASAEPSGFVGAFSFGCSVRARTHCTHAYVHTAMLLVPGDLHDETLWAVLLVVGQQPAERQAHQVVLAQLRAARQVQLSDELVQLLELLRTEAERVRGEVLLSAELLPQAVRDHAGRAVDAAAFGTRVRARTGAGVDARSVWGVSLIGSRLTAERSAVGGDRLVTGGPAAGGLKRGSR